MEFQAYIRILITWLLTSGLQIVITLVLAFIALKAGKIISRRFVLAVIQQKGDPEFVKRTQTLGSIIRYLLSTAILVITAIIVLGEFGVEIGPILAAAGVVGLAVGFGAQNLVRDVISGFFILLEDQIRVGDVVGIANKGGLVEKINLKTTTLRDLSGNVHFVPNGKIDVITNMTKEFSRYVFEIGVAYREDVDEVIDVIKKVDEELRGDPAFKNDILEPIEVLGLDQFANSSLIIKARTTTMPIKQWGVAREFNRRLKKKFDEKNIEIPFPHITLYLGQDKKGESPPLHVSLGKNDHSGLTLNSNQG